MQTIKQQRNEKILRILMYLIVTLITLSILIPVAWVFLASIKGKSEFYGSPWTFPQSFHIQNFIDAFQEAKMGQYFLMLVKGDRALVNMMPDGFFINNIFILALVYAATTVPFTIYLLGGYFKTISSTYEEAAMIDGATNFQIMTKVILPMAKPAIVTCMLFNFLSFWNDYIISLTLMPGENRTLQVGLLNLMTAQKAAANYGRLYAGMVIVMVPALILYAFIQKEMLEGMAQGGSKE